MTIDCILFYGGADLDLLKLRLAEHSKFVDRFLICETQQDFHGQSKLEHGGQITRLMADYDITYRALYEWPADLLTPFDKSNYWRNYIKFLLDYYMKAQPNDTIIFTDLDEILNPKMWNYTPDMGLMAVELKLYYYFVNLSAGGMWYNGFVAPYGFVKDKDVTDLRYNNSRRKHPAGILRNAGWHFAWLGGKEVIRDKFRNFGAAEGWNPALASDEYIDHILRDRILFSNSQPLELVPIDSSYPDELRFNSGKYLKFLYDIEK